MQLNANYFLCVHAFTHEERERKREREMLQSRNVTYKTVVVLQISWNVCLYVFFVCASSLFLLIHHINTELQRNAMQRMCMFQLTDKINICKWWKLNLIIILHKNGDMQKISTASAYLCGRKRSIFSSTVYGILWIVVDDVNT